MASMKSLLDPATLSELLLDLYAGCNELSMTAFQPHALSLVRSRLPFDSVWWAMVNEAGTVRSIHESYVDGLPAHIDKLWESIQHDDAIGVRSLQRLGQAINFTPEDIDRTEGSRWLARVTGFRHVLCATDKNPVTGQYHFLALSRHDDRHPFEETERQFHSLLMPHLNAALNVNWMSELRRRQVHGDATRHPMAVVDRLGVIHLAESGFTELLRREVPRWWGTYLPSPMREALRSNGATCPIGSLTARWSWVRDLALLELTQRSAVDLLSPRESEVAAKYAGGESYTEISQALQLSPATVRHHLRRIYTKLGISDKASLARTMMTGADIDDAGAIRR